jgi:cytochrome c oxidase assembly factor CtaG
MKSLAAALLVLAVPAGASAAQTEAAAPAAEAARFTLDTPIEKIVADPAGKAALEAAIPGISAHPHFDMFKAMSLKQVQPMSGGMLTEDMLKKAEASLAGAK